MWTDVGTVLFSAIIPVPNIVTLHIKESSISEWMNSLLEGSVELILTKIPNSANLVIKLTLTLEYRNDLIEVRNGES